jgi:phosphoribosyl-ATP pyrophosphohydrolase/phosphoribosyl-AMP cyclohydrolase
MSLTFDDKGLIPAIAQDRLTGQVRMVGFMNREALERTLETGQATFFSRSRQKLWQKGETSGNKLAVRVVLADCDADTLLLLVDPEGPTCHTGRPSCFFRRVTSLAKSSEPATVGQSARRAAAANETVSVESVDAALDPVPSAGPFLLELEHTLEERKTASAEKSYTKSLLEAGPAKIGEKVEEEAKELRQALIEASDDRVESEAADVLYHLLVGLQSRGIELRRVLGVLAARAGISGHAEKASRTRDNSKV